MISTKDLSNLPKPDELKQLLQAHAMLDAILEEEWDNRRYSFNAKWSAREQMGSMRNGCGDDFFAVFDAAGCFLRGFDHESVMSPWRPNASKVWPGVLDHVPDQFNASVNEPAFHMEDTTFCIWCLAGDAEWSCGISEFPPNEDDPDGSAWMLSPLNGEPGTYRKFAADYFELDVALEAIARVYNHDPLSVALLNSFPSSRNFRDVLLDAEEIGYPILR